MTRRPPSSTLFPSTPLFRSPGWKDHPGRRGRPRGSSWRAALPGPAGEANSMSRYYIVHLDRRHVPAVAGPFLTGSSAREDLEAVVIGAGVIFRRDRDDLLPLITLRGRGTPIPPPPRHGCPRTTAPS